MLIIEAKTAAQRLPNFLLPTSQAQRLKQPITRAAQQLTAREDRINKSRSTTLAALQT